MKIPLAEMIRRAGRTRPGTVVASALTPPDGLRTTLLRVYTRVTREWSDKALAAVLPQYERSVAAMMRDSPDEVQREVDEVGAALTRLVLTLNADLENWVVRVEEWHRGRFGTLFTANGVNLDTLLGRGEVTETLRSVLAENASLIRSMNDQMRNGISGSVFRGLANRTPAREVAKEIRATAAIGKRRAELIASDQLQKLSARLDQERQEQVGIEEFEWAHSRKKFPRLEHVDRNGKRYRWDSDVGKNDPPGRAIRCGCRSRAVLDL